MQWRSLHQAYSAPSAIRCCATRCRPDDDLGGAEGEPASRASRHRRVIIRRAGESIRFARYAGSYCYLRSFISSERIVFYRSRQRVCEATTACLVERRGGRKSFLVPLLRL